MIKVFYRSTGLFGIGACFLWGCTTSQFQTLTIFDDPNRLVALQVMPDAYGGKGYDHPIDVTETEMTAVLRGLRVEQGAFSAWGSGETQHAFSEGEIALFAPLFAKGLRQATPEELVTFFETAELSQEHQATTSGGMFVGGGGLHIVLSNYRVKTRIWRDVEQYQDSYRNRPLEPIEAQPGQLSYEPRDAIVSSGSGELGSFWKGKPWQIAIRLKNVGGGLRSAPSNQIIDR